MYKNRIVLFVCILLTVSNLAVAQNSTNSPYTRFGLGSVSDNANGARRALGGASIGFRSAKEINTVNPASYSAVDTLSFMFDVGFSGLYSYFSDANGSVGKMNGNLEYITLQFPVTRFLGISAGLLPYSFSGYSFSNSTRQQIDPQNPADTVWTTETYSGTGTVSQVYFGVAGKFLKHFSAGINAYYMFGNVSNDRIVSYNSTAYSGTNQENRISVSNVRFRYGLQYFSSIKNKHDISVGVFYENKKNGKFTSSQINTSQVADTVSSGDNFDLPQTFGIGAYYSLNKRFTVGADFSLQQWQNARFFGQTDSLSNRWKLAAGVEYIPNLNGYRYSDHLRYRAGLTLGNSYYDVNGHAMPLNIGVSVGLGIPMPKSNSMLNASLEYGKIGNRSLMTENYLKLTISATINEAWFFKRVLH
ncbi:membrane protein [Bacteroidia bacterium]|nr:membrane protein [Bacteroidia bacterium]